jgi:hypothetical protein
MSRKFTKEQLLKQGGTEDSSLQITVTHDMGDYLFLMVYYIDGNNHYEILETKTIKKNDKSRISDEHNDVQ